MATGDKADIISRLNRLVPPSWFSSDITPIIDSVMSGIAAPLSWAYSLYSYAVAQMRLATATGVWIDRISYDFLGNLLPRRSGETDASFSGRVKAEVLRPRLTRPAISKALQDLTGAVPLIFEPWNPGDCGGYNMNVMGYGCAGCYGSLSLPNQIFIMAKRPLGQGIPNVGGYGVGAIGYHVAGEYADMSLMVGPISDSAIYSTVANNKAAGTVAWVDIVSGFPTYPPDSAGHTH